MDPNLALGIAAILVTIVIAMMGWLLQRLSKLTEKVDEVSGSTRELRTTLVGVTGQNGLVSDVKDIRKRQHDFANKLNAFELRLGGARLSRPEDQT